MKCVSLLLLATALCFTQVGFGQAARRAPGFSLPDMQLKQHDLQDYRGKVVLIEFMKTQCPACQKMSVTLEAIKKQYGEKIAVFSVVHPPDNQSTVARYVAANGVTYPVLFDCGQMAASYLQATPSNPTIHLPHLVIVDQSGAIRESLNDSKSEELGQKGLTAILDEILKMSRAGLRVETLQRSVP
ncbi:MAG: TlpA family protein disulfide reductase [Bryobacteraceae bacterium]